MGKYEVNAGKYDGYERNYKYCDSFDNLDDAIAAYFSVSDYPWQEIIYHGVHNTEFTLHVNIPN
jgi:hypothetical protein